MPIATFVFNETSPSSPRTAASSQPVAGADAYLGLPPGVAGLIGDYKGAQLVADLVGATGGTLDVYVQNSPDGGLNWYDVVHFPQIAAGAALASYSAPISTATATSVPTQVGKNLSPALAANKVVNGALTDRLRLVMVAGLGTTAGAQVVVRVCPQRRRVRETDGS
jgi:hypothetical protein